MSNRIIEKYGKRIVPMEASEDLIKEYRTALKKSTKGVRLMNSPTAGNLAMFILDKYPHQILEIVLGEGGEDCCISLYKTDPLFNDMSVVEEVRWEIITEIAGLYSALPSAIRFDDGRDRKSLQMKELGTAQLLDNLANLTMSSI